MVNSYNCEQKFVEILLSERLEVDVLISTMRGVEHFHGWLQQSSSGGSITFGSGTTGPQSVGAFIWEKQGNLEKKELNDSDESLRHGNCKKLNGHCLMNSNGEKGHGDE